MELVKLLPAIVTYALIVMVLFYLIRALTLWYWRINEIVELLRSIDKSLLTAVERASKRPAALPLKEWNDGQ